MQKSYKRLGPRFPDGKIKLEFLLKIDNSVTKMWKERNYCTFGVRSAWRNTVTLAFNNHVGDSCGGMSAAGTGNDSRIHKAASISAALSRV